MQILASRLTLREAETADAAGLSAYQSDPRYLEHYLEAPDARAIVAAAISWKDASPRLNYQFIVVREGEVIGCAGVRQAGWPRGEAEIGVEIDPRHWGAGYASEVTRSLLGLAREPLHLARLHAITTSTNRRAMRLVERFGFLPVGTDGRSAHYTLDLSPAR